MRWTLRVLPRMFAILAICTAVVALGLRNAWPTLTETAMFVLTIICWYGAMRIPNQNSKLILSTMWLAGMVIFANTLSLPQVWHDFRTFVDGAHLLFESDRSPYSVQGVTAFPFPTFFLVYALGATGTMSFTTVAWVYSFIQVLLLALSYLLANSLVGRENLEASSKVWLSLIFAGVIIHPATLLGLYYGQSSIVAGTTLLGAIWLWRCGRTKCSWHGAAVLFNLAWMVKPQLLMVSGYFLLRWVYALKIKQHRQDEDVRIGRLLILWAVALLGISIVIGGRASLLAYRDFINVAYTWHTYIALIQPNNYALPAILAKAGSRYFGVEASEAMFPLTATCAFIVVLWNVVATLKAKPNSLVALLPWVLSSLLWSSLCWRLYLSLIIGGILVITAYTSTLRRGSESEKVKTLWLGLGIACSLVLSNFIFTLGLLLLYFLSHELLHDETTAQSLVGGQEYEFSQNVEKP